MIKYREPLYAALKARAGEKVNLDELVDTVKLNRKDSSSQLRQMMKLKEYPGLKVYSRKNYGTTTFGHPKPVYVIHWKYEV